MSDSYNIRTISDLMKIPLDCIDRFIEDLRLAMEAARFVCGEDFDQVNFDEFIWTDDGESSVTVDVVEVSLDGGGEDERSD